MNNNILYKYRNGNYDVILYNNGTKVRFTYDNYLKPIYPESIDVKITNKCDLNCLQCHENSTIDGAHGYILNNLDIFENLPAGIEIAIGGGNPLCHPDLTTFITYLSIKGLVCSMTVNSKHLYNNDKYVDIVNYLIEKKLIYGLGISYSNLDILLNVINKINNKSNIVIHVIAGLITIEELEKLLKRFKVLILGYKIKGRGKQYYNNNISKNIDILKSNIKYILKDKIVSFDNLAIQQLDILSLLSDEEKKLYYMGDDGKFSFYVDMVTNTYAISSTENERKNIYNLNIKECFNNL